MTQLGHLLIFHSLSQHDHKAGQGCPELGKENTLQDWRSLRDVCHNARWWADLERGEDINPVT
jgi:hypothetical protein